MARGSLGKKWMSVYHGLNMKKSVVMYYFCNFFMPVCRGKEKEKSFDCGVYYYNLKQCMSKFDKLIICILLRKKCNEIGFIWLSNKIL